MIESWFDPNQYAWIPGAALGVLGGLHGTLAGCLAPRGKCKGLVLGMHFGILACCGLLFLCGIVGYAVKQPDGVVYGVGFPGLLGLCIFGSLAPLVLKRYREAEMRRSMAQDL
jgi:hypothetical protein